MRQCQEFGLTSGESIRGAGHWVRRASRADEPLKGWGLRQTRGLCCPPTPDIVLPQAAPAASMVSPMTGTWAPALPPQPERIDPGGRRFDRDWLRSGVSLPTSITHPAMWPTKSDSGALVHEEHIAGHPDAPCWMHNTFSRARALSTRKRTRFWTTSVLTAPLWSGFRTVGGNGVCPHLRIR